MAKDTALQQEEQYLLTTFRRDLHRIPELGFNLPKTCRYITQVLEGLNCTVFVPCASTVCAFFDFKKETTTAIRADMDALPIYEQLDEDCTFVSQHLGVMHACGHDGHMAMALALAAYVSKLESDLPHNVLFVFQPAEETTGGAKVVCESGVFAHYNVTSIYGFHLWPDLPACTLGMKSGALLARASETTLTIEGVSSHIAKHEQGRDALLSGAQFVCSCDAVMNELNEVEPCLLKFGHMTSGNVRNAISNTTVIEGSLRVFSDEMFTRAKEEVSACAQKACDAHGCGYDLHFAEGYPPVINDEILFAKSYKTLSKDRHLSIERIEKPLLIAEDFAFYQEKLPGLFMLLGTGTGIPLHSDTFNFDESVLYTGLQVYKHLIAME